MCFSEEQAPEVAITRNRFNASTWAIIFWYPFSTGTLVTWGDILKKIVSRKLSASVTIPKALLVDYFSADSIGI